MRRRELMRAPLLWLVIPMLIGIAAGRAFSETSTVGALGLAAFGWAAIAAFFVRKDDNVSMRAWMLAAIFGGITLGAALIRSRETDFSTWEKLPPREVAIEIQIETLWGGSDTSESARGIARIVSAPPILADVIGMRASFSFKTGNAKTPILRTTRLSVKGVLVPIPSRDAEGFERFLRDSDVRFRLTRGWINEVVASPSAFAAWCARTDQRMAEILEAGLESHERLRGVLVAMLLGRSAELTSDQKELFLRSGTMHLFAISGLHVVVIAGVIHALLGFLRLPRVIVVLLTAGVLWLYVQVTGAAPSATRAWTMVTLVFAARELRWPGSSLAGLCAAAFVVLLVDPLALFGVGFQMSYAVVAALLLYGLPLGAWLSARWTPFAALPENSLGAVRRALRLGWIKFCEHTALCIAATLGSMLPVIGTFGLLTPGSILANFILVPVSSLVLAAGVASLCAGFFGLKQLCILFNSGAALVIFFMEKIAALEVRLPASHLEMTFRWSWLQSFGLLLLLLIFFAGYGLRWRRKFGGFLSPVILLALILLIGAKPASQEKDLREQKMQPASRLR